jgi:hypothetical protein
MCMPTSIPYVKRHNVTNNLVRIPQRKGGRNDLTQVVRICKYGCNTQLGQFDTKQNKYLESDGTIHSRERCESLKQNKALDNWTNDKPKQDTNGHNDISVEVLLKRLDQLGVKIDLEKLRNV